MPKRAQTNQDKGKRKQRSDGQSGQREARTKGKRLAFAKEAITKALEADDCLDSHEDIVRILRRYLRDRDLPKDHFDVLDASDHFNLYIDIIKSQNQIARPGPPSSRARTSHTHHAKFSTSTVPQSPDSGTVIRHGQVSPVPSTTSTDCDAQSEGRAEQECDGEARQDSLVVTPLEGDEGNPFNVYIYHTSRTGPEVVKAFRCQNDRSYVSAEIIRRHHLVCDTHDSLRSIRFTWEESDTDRQGPKSKSTRFYVVEDETLRNDLAIGTEWAKIDKSDDEGGGFELGNHEVAHESMDSEDGEEEEEDDDMSQDGSGDEEEASEDDSEGHSVTSKSSKGETEDEDGTDEEHTSSDDSFVQVSHPDQIIGPSSLLPPICGSGQGPRAAAEFFHYLGKYGNGGANYHGAIPVAARLRQPISSSSSSSKQSSNSYKAKSTKQRSKDTKPRKPAAEPERRSNKNSATKAAPVSSKRSTNNHSRSSNESLPPSLPPPRKAKKK